jgi:hypothetical protein
MVPYKEAALQAIAGNWWKENPCQIVGDTLAFYRGLPLSDNRQMPEKDFPREHRYANGNVCYIARLNQFCNV